MTETFTCTVCKKIFDQVLTDEEAAEQLKQEFPDVNVKDCVAVCDDCFKEMEKAGTFKLPEYKTPGRILVRVTDIGEQGKVEWEYEVLAWDVGTCVFWINEGVGFDYWLADCEFPGPGTYVVEGIVGQYHRGTIGWDDDDEDWEYKSIRPATEEEIRTETLT